MKKSDLNSSRLIEMLRLSKQLSVTTVSDSLGVSIATVRRLLARLEGDGKVIRTHGGVRLAPHLGTDYSYYMSATHRSREKALIGRAVAEIIADGESLFLDSGTTVLKLAEALSLRVQAESLKGIVVLTNSLALVETLARWCKVILVGGEARVERRDVCGSITEETLHRFRVNKAFFGADAIHIRSGFMTTDERTAKMNEIILRNANHVFVLADSEKFGRDAFIRYAALNEVETIFTDPGLTDAALREFTDAGARIQIVQFSPNRAARAGS